jgi:hypothetical protein
MPPTARQSFVRPHLGLSRRRIVDLPGKPWERETGSKPFPPRWERGCHRQVTKGENPCFTNVLPEKMSDQSTRLQTFVRAGKGWDGEKWRG